MCFSLWIFSSRAHFIFEIYFVYSWGVRVWEIDADDRATLQEDQDSSKEGILMED